MKVDIQRMDEAYIQLMNLQQQLREVENRIREVQQFLDQQKLGSAAQTAAIRASLILQMDAVERRAEGTENLARVLRSARDHYKSCETTVRNTAEYNDRRKSGSVIDYLDMDKGIQIKLVPLLREREVIDRYIRPLMATGKKVTT